MMSFALSIPSLVLSNLLSLCGAEEWREKQWGSPPSHPNVTIQASKNPSFYQTT